MKLKVLLISIFIIGTLFLSSGCTVFDVFSPTETPTLTVAPTFTPIPSPTPTHTLIPFYLNATVISGTLQVPILIYHRFIPDDGGETTATKMRISDFQGELQAFYDNGFSLIPLSSWINGTFSVPVGRKPLIITMDDLWFADQLFIEADGNPSELSGLGVLWNFYQSHPEFGFYAAVFSNMGDKYFADKRVGDRFILGEGDQWKDALGNTIAWAIENEIEVYNHLYQHPKLDITENKDILYQIRQNDEVTRYYLNRVGRSDLISKLDNLIALPYGIWPETQSGRNIILNYKNPEGKPLMAVMEAYNLDAAQLSPSFYSPGFDPYKIARITASKYMVEYIIENKELVPTAVSCPLGPLEESQANQSEVIIHLIKNAIQLGKCPKGIYHVSDSIFNALDENVRLQYGSVSALSSFPTPSVTPSP